MMPRGPEFFAPVLHGKPGVARMALESGAPVIPIALWDTEHIWPRSARLPNVAMIGGTVHARVGEPMWLKAPAGEEEDKALLDALATQVMDRISELLPDEVRAPGPPSPEELSAATPPKVPPVKELVEFPMQTSSLLPTAVTKTRLPLNGAQRGCDSTSPTEVRRTRFPPSGSTR